MNNGQTYKCGTLPELGARIAQWYSPGLQAGWLSIQVLTGAGNFISSPLHPDMLWGPPSLLSSG